MNVGETKLQAIFPQEPKARDDSEEIKVSRASSSVSDIMCGVSNVVYRKEY